MSAVLAAVARVFSVAWAAGMRLPWLARWLWAWWRLDPQTPHSHLGPVAVAPTNQGAGVGTALLRAYVSQLDACEVPGYLETDSEANVRFYAACVLYRCETGGPWACETGS